MYDLIISNAKIYDGTGKSAYYGSVAVKDGKIATVSSEPLDNAREIIDAEGLALAPGFIDCHNHSEHDQVPYAAHLMAKDTGDDHKYRAAQSQNRHYKTANHTLVFFFAHPLYEHRQVHHIDGDDGQFGRVKHERTGPGAGKVRHIEVQKPCGNDHQGQNGSVVGHIGACIDLTVDIGGRTLTTGSQSVKTPGACHHQTVHGTDAGNGNEQLQNVTQNRSKHIAEGHGSADSGQISGGCAACDTYEVKHISSYDDDTTQDQRLG